MDRMGPAGRIALALFLAALTGCSQLPRPDYAFGADHARNSVSEWQYAQSNATRVSQLTDLVSVPELTTLVQQALTRNPGLQQTALALKIAYAERQITGATGLPAVTASFKPTRTEASQTTYSTSVDISWELDLWRKLAADLRAAELDIAASAATLQSARDALAASVMRNWLDIILQRQLIVIESARLVVLESNEQLVAQRYRNGFGDLTGLDSARTGTAISRATLVDYQQALARSQRSLRQLLGLEGQATDLPPAAAFPRALQPLTGLPEQDLARRPDLQQGYYNILAAGYRSQVAYKDLLPAIDLAASFTELAASPADALLKSPAWSLLGQITAPLFQGGKLRARADIAAFSHEQQFLAYQETLLTAVTEVNDALGQEQSLQLQQQHLEDALASARRSAANYQTKYRQGLVDILDLLAVQQQTFDLQLRLAQTTHKRLSNRINLGLALGLGVST